MTLRAHTLYASKFRVPVKVRGLKMSVLKHSNNHALLDYSLSTQSTHYLQQNT